MLDNSSNSINNVDEKNSRTFNNMKNSEMIIDKKSNNNFINDGKLPKKGNLDFSYFNLKNSINSSPSKNINYIFKKNNSYNQNNIFNNNQNNFYDQNSNIFNNNQSNFYGQNNNIFNKNEQMGNDNENYENLEIQNLDKPEKRREYIYGKKGKLGTRSIKLGTRSILPQANNISLDMSGIGSNNYFNINTKLSGNDKTGFSYNNIFDYNKEKDGKFNILANRNDRKVPVFKESPNKFLLKDKKFKNQEDIDQNMSIYDQKMIKNQIEYRENLKKDLEETLKFANKRENILYVNDSSSDTEEKFDTSINENDISGYGYRKDNKKEKANKEKRKKEKEQRKEILKNIHRLKKEENKNYKYWYVLGKEEKYEFKENDIDKMLRDFNIKLLQGLEDTLGEIGVSDDIIYSSNCNIEKINEFIEMIKDFKKYVKRSNMLGDNTKLEIYDKIENILICIRNGIKLEDYIVEQAKEIYGGDSNKNILELRLNNPNFNLSEFQENNKKIEELENGIENIKSDIQNIQLNINAINRRKEMIKLFKDIKDNIDSFTGEIFTNIENIEENMGIYLKSIEKMSEKFEEKIKKNKDIIKASYDIELIYKEIKYILDEYKEILENKDLNYENIGEKINNDINTLLNKTMEKLIKDINIAEKNNIKDEGTNIDEIKDKKIELEKRQKELGIYKKKRNDIISALNKEDKEKIEKFIENKKNAKAHLEEKIKQYKDNLENKIYGSIKECISYLYEDENINILDRFFLDELITNIEKCTKQLYVRLNFFTRKIENIPNNNTLVYLDEYLKGEFTNEEMECTEIRNSMNVNNKDFDFMIKKLKIELKEYYGELKNELSYIEKLLNDEDFGKYRKKYDEKEVFEENVRKYRKCLEAMKGITGWKFYANNMPEHIHNAVETIVRFMIKYRNAIIKNLYGIIKNMIYSINEINENIKIIRNELYNKDKYGKMLIKDTINNEIYKIVNKQQELMMQINEPENMESEEDDEESEPLQKIPLVNVGKNIKSFYGIYRNIENLRYKEPIIRLYNIFKRISEYTNVLDGGIDSLRRNIDETITFYVKELEKNYENFKSQIKSEEEYIKEQNILNKKKRQIDMLRNLQEELRNGNMRYEEELNNLKDNDKENGIAFINGVDKVPVLYTRLGRFKEIINIIHRFRKIIGEINKDPKDKYEDLVGDLKKERKKLEGDLLVEREISCIRNGIKNIGHEDNNINWIKKMKGILLTGEIQGTSKINNLKQNFISILSIFGEIENDFEFYERNIRDIKDLGEKYNEYELQIQDLELNSEDDNNLDKDMISTMKYYISEEEKIIKKYEDMRKDLCEVERLRNIMTKMREIKDRILEIIEEKEIENMLSDLNGDEKLILEMYSLIRDIIRKLEKAYENNYKILNEIVENIIKTLSDKEEEKTVEKYKKYKEQIQKRFNDYEMKRKIYKFYMQFYIKRYGYTADMTGKIINEINKSDGLLGLTEPKDEIEVEYNYYMPNEVATYVNCSKDQEEEGEGEGEEEEGGEAEVEGEEGELAQVEGEGEEGEVVQGEGEEGEENDAQAASKLIVDVPKKEENGREIPKPKYQKIINFENEDDEKQNEENQNEENQNEENQNENIEGQGEGKSSKLKYKIPKKILNNPNINDENDEDNENNENQNEENKDQDENWEADTDIEDSNDMKQIPDISKIRNIGVKIKKNLNFQRVLSELNSMSEYKHRMMSENKFLDDNNYDKDKEKFNRNISRYNKNNNLLLTFMNGAEKGENVYFLDVMNNGDIESENNLVKYNVKKDIVIEADLIYYNYCHAIAEYIHNKLKEKIMDEIKKIDACLIYLENELKGDKNNRKQKNNNGKRERHLNNEIKYYEKIKNELNRILQHIEGIFNLNKQDNEKNVEVNVLGDYTSIIKKIRFIDEKCLNYLEQIEKKKRNIMKEIYNKLMQRKEYVKEKERDYLEIIEKMRERLFKEYYIPEDFKNVDKMVAQIAETADRNYNNRFQELKIHNNRPLIIPSQKNDRLKRDYRIRFPDRINLIGKGNKNDNKKDDEQKSGQPSQIININDNEENDEQKSGQPSQIINKIKGPEAYKKSRPDAFYILAKVKNEDENNDENENNDEPDIIDDETIEKFRTDDEIVKGIIQYNENYVNSIGQDIFYYERNNNEIDQDYTMMMNSTIQHKIMTEDKIEKGKMKLANYKKLINKIERECTEKVKKLEAERQKINDSISKIQATRKLTDKENKAFADEFDKNSTEINTLIDRKDQDIALITEEMKKIQESVAENEEELENTKKELKSLIVNKPNEEEQNEQEEEEFNGLKERLNNTIRDYRIDLIGNIITQYENVSEDADLEYECGRFIEKYIYILNYKIEIIKDLEKKLGDIKRESNDDAQEIKDKIKEMIVTEEDEEKRLIEMICCINETSERIDPLRNDIFGNNQQEDGNGQENNPKEQENQGEDNPEKQENQGENNPKEQNEMILQKAQAEQLVQPVMKNEKGIPKEEKNIPKEEKNMSKENEDEDDDNDNDNNEQSNDQSNDQSKSDKIELNESNERNEIEENKEIEGSEVQKIIPKKIIPKKIIINEGEGNGQGNDPENDNKLKQDIGNQKKMNQGEIKNGNEQGDNANNNDEEGYEYGILPINEIETNIRKYKEIIENQIYELGLYRLINDENNVFNQIEDLRKNKKNSNEMLSYKNIKLKNNKEYPMLISECFKIRGNRKIGVYDEKTGEEASYDLLRNDIKMDKDEVLQYHGEKGGQRIIEDIYKFDEDIYRNDNNRKLIFSDLLKEGAYNYFGKRGVELRKENERKLRNLKNRLKNKENKNKNENKENKSKILMNSKNNYNNYINESGNNINNMQDEKNSNNSPKGSYISSSQYKMNESNRLNVPDGNEGKAKDIFLLNEMTNKDKLENTGNIQENEINNKSNKNYNGNKSLKSGYIEMVKNKDLKNEENKISGNFEENNLINNNNENDNENDNDNDYNLFNNNENENEKEKSGELEVIKDYNEKENSLNRNINIDEDDNIPMSSKMGSILFNKKNMEKDIENLKKDLDNADGKKKNGTMTNL